ncbi:MAG TPA: ABC transporter substrate-binding protein [Hyalangium sp.]|nr:ABC transporter substrate-binding protein [Hyalangium sp.]
MLAHLIITTLLAAAPGPLKTVRSGYEDVQKAATAPGATIEKVAQAVDRFVDFEELARRALGDTWNSITPTQRKELTGAMRGMLRSFYAQRILSQPDNEVTYGQELLQGNESTVSTVLRVEGNRIPITYKLYRAAPKEKSWRIYDIVTADVSLLEDYRSQFSQLLAEQGFDGLLSTIKARQAQLHQPTATSKAPKKKTKKK